MSETPQGETGLMLTDPDRVYVAVGGGGGAVKRSRHVKKKSGHEPTTVTYLSAAQPPRQGLGRGMYARTALSHTSEHGSSEAIKSDGCEAEVNAEAMRL